MGTRWRGVLAPINTPTGDGRRMATGAFTHRPLPLPLRWQRPETSGHDDAVTVGVIDTLRIDDEAGHVWGEGELFDDINPAANPRLAEDVNEAKFLLGKKAIGPSVDPGHASAVAVVAGTDTPVTEQSMFEQMLAGATEAPATETLFTAYEIAGATLVPVPAFAECRPFELITPGVAIDTPTGLSTQVSAILAAAMLGIDPAVFTDPGLQEITPITRQPLPNGLVRVFGHVATHDTCLVGQRDVCTTAPYSSCDYTQFHRYHGTDDGSMRFPLPVGRLTAAFGTLENTCRCCPGNDDHACANISFGAAIAHHDRMETLAYVRAGEDETNNAIWFSGIEAPQVSEQGQKLLARRKISGDWRFVRGDMEMTEILVLNRREPGFPLPRASMRGGRQLALTAAGVVRAPMDRQEQTVTSAHVDEFANAHPAGWGDAAVPLEAAFEIDYDRLGVSVAEALILAAQAGPVATMARVPEGEVEDGEDEDDEDDEDNRKRGVTAAAPGGHTGAMLALRMTDQDAARLCVHDGLPIDELHSTLAYLGEAEQIAPEVRERMIKDVTKLAAKMQPFSAEVADLTVFNPGNNNDREPALVLGLTGQELADLHDGVVAQMTWDGHEMPQQFSPYKPHITLRQPAGDINRIEALADRMGPVTFDRLRLAFGGEVIDVPLGGPVVVGQGYDVVNAGMMLRARAAQAKLAINTKAV